MKRWYLYIISFAFAACSPMVEQKKNTIYEYYDVNGLIDEQVRLLDSISPSLSKIATIDGIEEAIEIMTPDSLWEEELSIFKSIDINKPMLMDRYDTFEVNHGKEKVKTLISKSPRSTNVDTLQISFSNAHHPTHIYAHLASQNSLFRTSKKMELIFTDHNGLLLLESYSIQGWQKMISKDTTTFSIQARIVF